MLEEAIDRDLVAAHDVEHARGQAGLGEQLRAHNIDADGSRSLGSSTNVFPHAIAIGYIHIGTIAGKLNGVMPAPTPSGCRASRRSCSRAIGDSATVTSSLIPWNSCGAYM